jgi:hypothetical protein
LFGRAKPRSVRFLTTRKTNGEKGKRLVESINWEHLLYPYAIPQPAVRCGKRCAAAYPWPVRGISHCCKRRWWRWRGQAARAEIPKRWCKALADGTMAVVSVSVTNQRLTEKAARDRNDLAARLADRVVIGHASTDGQLSKQCANWLADSLPVEWLSR